MTKQEDIWNCFNCGNPQGRHDIWFEEDLCEKCNSENNYAIINYDKKELSLTLNKEAFVFDLTLGDIGAYWYGFKTNDGEVYNVEFGEEEGESNPSVSVYGTILEDDGEFSIDSDNRIDINIKETNGERKNYFNN
jgi:hypothetical protein